MAQRITSTPFAHIITPLPQINTPSIRHEEMLILPLSQLHTFLYNVGCKMTYKSSFIKYLTTPYVFYFMQGQIQGL